MSLPVEILDHILAFLQSDKATLEVCSKSHPSLSQLVERHLYANVIIDQHSGSNDFREVLRAHPHVANYVRTLGIAFERDSRDTEVFLEGISVILPKFSKLRNIGVRTTSVPPVAWAKLPEKFCVAFLDCLRLPSLTDIRMESISFPLSTLSLCKHIRNLTLNRCDGAGSDNTRLPTIDSLALYDCDTEFLSTIVSWIQSRHLSSLTFSRANMRPSLLKSFPQILICCSHSLTSLDVDISCSYASYYHFKRLNTARHPDEAIPIPLSGLPNLQQLTVQAVLWGIDFEFHSPISAIADVLRPASSLKQLTLDFLFVVSPNEDPAMQHNITEVLCTPLHSLLVQSASPVGPINLHVMPFALPPDVILQMFAGHPALVPFVENGKLVLTISNRYGQGRAIAPFW